MSTRKFQCPQCKAVFSEEGTMPGNAVSCPKCFATFAVPKAEEGGESVAEKPPVEKWLMHKGHEFGNWTAKMAIWAAKRAWKASRIFLSFERPQETDVSHFANAASTFEFSRLFPLAVICLGFGWYVSWAYIGQDLDFRYAYESRWGILPMAILALYGAIRAIRHFLRPKVSQWGAWIVTCLFTAVAGILLLFAFQHIADWSVEAAAKGKFKPRNILMLGVLFIGFCYKWVNDPYSSFFAKFIGNIGGVGFCEEATKLLPICLLVLNRRKLPFRLDLSLRSFLMLGFFSGLGFGISEALFGGYAIPENDDFVSQLCRWFACVPSHAVYTVIDAAFLWMFHRQIAKAEKDREKVGWFALCVAAVALLHGIYDTLYVLPFAGPVLDAASLVLMWKVVRYAANHYTSVEDGEYTGLEDFNAISLRTFGKSFAKTYLIILIGVVIYAKVSCL